MTADRKVAIRTVTVIRDKVPTPSGTDGFVLTEQGGLMVWAEPASQLPELSGVDGHVLTERAGSVGWESPTDLDDKVRATAADTTPAYLQGKLSAGANVALSVVDPGEDEKIQITAIVPASADEKVKTEEDDDTAGFLGDKLVAGAGVSIETVPGPPQALEISAVEIIHTQSELLLRVAVDGTDGVLEGRPARLYGGDYRLQPFATMAAALQSIGDTRSEKVTIELGAGNWPPIDLTGKNVDKELWIVGTLGTAIGPFTITTEVQQYWSYQVSGATWTPNAYAGLQFEITSGPGAGGKGTVYSNTSDTINFCASQYAGVGSVIRLLPFATRIDGDGDEYNATVNLHSLKGKFVLKNLDCVSYLDQEANINIANCYGARVGLYNVRASGVGNGIQSDGVGCLLLMFCWFNGDYDSAKLSHVLSTYLEPEADEDWNAPYAWYHVGFAYDAEFLNGGAWTDIRCRGLYLIFKGIPRLHFSDIYVDEDQTLYIQQCGAVEGLMSSAGYGGDAYITDCASFKSAGNGLMAGLVFTRVGTITIGTWNLLYVSAEACGVLNLNSTRFVTTFGSIIMVNNGTYAYGSFKYLVGATAFVRLVSTNYAASDFNPGPTTKTDTNRRLTVTLQGSTS